MKKLITLLLFFTTTLICAQTIQLGDKVFSAGMPQAYKDTINTNKKEIDSLKAVAGLQFDRKTANYTLTASDATTYNRIVKMDMSSAGTVTIPTGTFTHGQSIIIHNQASDTVTIVGGSGVDFPSDIKIGQNRSITIVKDSISGNAERFRPLGGGWNLAAGSSGGGGQTSDTLDVLGRYPKELLSGNWDMDATASISIAHGLNANEWRSITDLSAIIKNDDSTSYKQIDSLISFTDTNIVLDRITSGTFDGTDYNATGFDRATVTFMYKPAAAAQIPSSVDIASLVSYYDAETLGAQSSNISAWNDLKNSHNAIAPSGGEPTVNISGGKKEVSFDGTNDYLVIAEHADFDFTPGTDEFTIMVEIGSTLPTDGYFFNKGVSDPSLRQYGLGVLNTEYDYFVNMGGTYFQKNTNHTTQAGEVLFVRVTTTQVQLVLDGQTDSDNISGTANSIGDLIIGARRNSGNTGGAFFYDGSIRKIVIWNEALSDTKISEIRTQITNQ